MEQIEKFIATSGFPIVACCFMFYFSFVTVKTFTIALNTLTIKIDDLINHLKTK